MAEDRCLQVPGGLVEAADIMSRIFGPLAGSPGCVETMEYDLVLTGLTVPLPPPVVSG